MSDNANKSSNVKRSSRTEQRRKQVRLRIFLLAVFLAAAAAILILLIIKLTPTGRHVTVEEYFGQMNEDEAAIVLQDHILTDDRALILENEAVYLPYELVRSSLNERFFLDEDNSEILFTTAVQTFVIPVDSASFTVISGALPSDPSSEEAYDRSITVRGQNGALYLSLDFLARYTDIAWTYEPVTRHVFIRTVFGQYLTSVSKKEAAVRLAGSIKSPIAADLDKGETVTVLEQDNSWIKVQTKDGIIGWAKSNRMSEPESTDILNEGFTPVEYPSITMEERVALVWHMITTQADNKSFAQATESMTGVNVISPTWFSLADNEGNVDSLGSTAYVEEAHAKGLQVWGLVDDFSPDMDNSLMLASTSARRNCISQLISYAKTLGIDGINIDFEHIDPGDAYTYTQFLREMSIACRLSSLVLSVDTFPPYDFNAHLNRVEAAAVCDYLINMGYDEHYVGSESAGSVASLGFEKGAIENLLLMGIPAEKLISAVPFYTRIWYTSDDQDGNTHINSETLSMSSVSDTLKSWSLTPQWDPVTSQNYIAWYTDDGVLCEIWIEDAQSLERKLLLVSSNNLAGCAIWALGFQDDSVWSTVADTLALPQDEALRLSESLESEDIAQAAQGSGDSTKDSTETEEDSRQAAG